MGFSNRSRKVLVALLLSLIAFLFDIIGFRSTNWVHTSVYRIGLFQSCVGLQCAPYDGVDWQVTARALNVIGFLLGLGCVVVICVYVLVKNTPQIVKKLACSLAFTAAGFIIVGSLLFAAKYTENSSVAILRWSFAQTIISGVVYIAAGVVMTM